MRRNGEDPTIGKIVSGTIVTYYDTKWYHPPHYFYPQHFPRPLILHLERYTQKLDIVMQNKFGHHFRLPTMLWSRTLDFSPLHRTRLIDVETS